MSARSFSEVIKDQPGADAVHVASAGGDGATEKPKAKTFKEVVANGARPKNGGVVKAEAKPLYVHRKVTNAQDLIDWAKSNGFETTLPADDMHTTVVYSKKAMDWAAAGDHFDHLRFSGADGRSVEKFGDAAVLRYAAPELQDRHKQFMDAGASHDFPEFNPHVTLSWKAPPDLDVSKIEPYAGPIELGPEVYGDIKSDWKDSLVEKSWEITVPISKLDADQNLVFGWASITEENGEPVVDSQGDVISEEDLEKAFYGLADEAIVAGEMHADVGAHIGKMVECMVFTKAKQEALGIDLGKIGAWVGFRVSPEVFAKVKSGDYPAFSIGGSGRRVPISEGDSPPS